MTTVSEMAWTPAVIKPNKDGLLIDPVKEDT